MTYVCKYFVYIDNRKPNQPIIGRQVSQQFKQLQKCPQSYTILGSNLSHTQAKDLADKLKQGVTV
jgi:hypothetical protein